MPFKIISTGWDNFESGGSDGYMFNSGKKGRTLECGPTKDYKKHIGLAVVGSLHFLKHYGIIDQIPKTKTVKQQLIKIKKSFLSKRRVLSSGESIMILTGWKKEKFLRLMVLKNTWSAKINALFFLTLIVRSAAKLF